jgi:hypothetical protein
MHRAKIGRAVNANEAFESASAANSGGLGRVLRAMDTRDAVLAEIEQVFAFGVSKMRTDPFSTGTRRQTPALTAASGTSAGWTAIGVAAYCAEVATCDGRSTLRRYTGPPFARGPTSTPAPLSNLLSFHQTARRLISS